MIDVLKLKPGRKIRTKDGRDLFVSGVYLSNDGVVVRAKQERGQLVEQNVPLEVIEELKEE